MSDSEMCIVHGTDNTVGILECYVDLYVDFMRKLIKKYLKYSFTEKCELIYNVLHNEKMVWPTDTL